MRNLTCLVLFGFAMLAPPSPAGAAPPGCKGAAYHGFDYMLGTWIAHNTKGQLNGKAEVDSVLAGCSVRMHWTGRTYEGTNNNSYDAARALWQKAWFDNTGGIELSEGHIVNGALVYVGYDYDKGKVVSMHRESWIPLPDGRVAERYEGSTDHGRTWKTAWTTTYTRVPRAAYGAVRIVQDR
jgi:hypothetical protein